MAENVEERVTRGSQRSCHCSRLFQVLAAMFMEPWNLEQKKKLAG